jgi:DNA replication protein DnaC
MTTIATTKQQNMVWLGPTGCGKTGLATSFLLQAIDRGYRGYFTTFPERIAELFSSLADRSEQKVLRRYQAYDCLLIDEVGYIEVEPAQVGLFFTLIEKRHKQKTTFITSNLGFREWGSFLKNNHLTAALIDRLTENSHVIHMKDCKSLRDPLAVPTPQAMPHAPADDSITDDSITADAPAVEA